MKKIIKFRTRSLGSEPDTQPDPGAIGQWIHTRRGTGGDLVLFHLQHLLGFQRDAGISSMCAGGLFYQNRLLECLKGIGDGKISGELDCDPGHVKADIQELVRPQEELWVAMPAPRQLGLKDIYYGDAEEAHRALIFQYKRLMREMRDSGAAGHVLLYNNPDQEEFEVFSGKKVFFFSPGPDREGLELLLEHQNTIAISEPCLDLLIDMIEEYPVRHLVILDPTTGSLTKALRHWDHEYISLGGYCRDNHREYWNGIVENSSYEIILSE
jgi:hypothetical protein